jgi:hypothetical protein
MTKLDYLGECNDQGVPLEDFRLAFCVRCFQKDCTRSQFGTSKFEARVNTWEERLFSSPPQLPKNDPRYPAITAKRFLTLPAGPIPSVREWIDPQTLDTSPSPNQASPAPIPQIVRVAETPAPMSEPAPETSAPMSEEVKKTQESPRPRQNLFVNTPYTGPRMLANQPTPPSEKPRDAWSAPEPLKPGEKVIKPGARVKIGGSG